MLRPPRSPLLFLFVAIVCLKDLSTIDASSGNKNPCICEHCDEKEVKAIEETDENSDEDVIVKDMRTEDFDGDGDRTICARDRDLNDRTFPSICHMLCHNECVRYRILIYRVNREKKYTASAFRTNYYKLHDGYC